MSLPRGQVRAEVSTLFEHILEHINNTLIPRHRAGEMDATDLVYIASTALCEAAVSVLFQNPMVSDDGAVQKVTKGFCEMFERKATQMVKHARQHLGQQAAQEHQDHDVSAWD